MTALTLVRDHDVIVDEMLKISNMTKRPKPRPEGNGGREPNGAAAKAGLNKSINDAGWGTFLRILHQAHADVNAAKNILRAGLARQEAHNAA